MSYNVKQVIVIRKDLHMRLGKSCAQAAHASMKVFFDRMEDYEREESNGVLISDISCDFTDEMIVWMETSFTKIVVSVDSEGELLEIYNVAKNNKIPCSLILDNGQTEFKQDCPDCKGEGELCIFDHKELDHDVMCPKCQGTGKVNKPTYTCVAVGPDLSTRIDKITGLLKLL